MKLLFELIFDTSMDAPKWKQWMWFKIGWPIRNRFWWPLICRFGKHRWQYGVFGEERAAMVRHCLHGHHLSIRPGFEEWFSPEEQAAMPPVYEVDPSHRRVKA